MPESDRPDPTRSLRSRLAPLLVVLLAVGLADVAAAKRGPKLKKSGVVEEGYGFVGPSAESFFGSIGILGAKALCEETFPRSRMCTTKDLILSTGPPFRGTHMWVMPSIVGFSFGIALDASGVSASPENLTCNGWSQSSATWTGLVAVSDGSMFLSDCSRSLPVACCAPRK